VRAALLCAARHAKNSAIRRPYDKKLSARKGANEDSDATRRIEGRIHSDWGVLQMAFAFEQARNLEKRKPVAVG